ASWPRAARPSVRSGGPGDPGSAGPSAAAVHRRAAPDSAGFFIHRHRSRYVLERGSGAVKDRDLILARATRAAARDDIRELGVDTVRREQSGREGVMQFADFRALVKN